MNKEQAKSSLSDVHAAAVCKTFSCVFFAVWILWMVLSIHVHFFVQESNLVGILFGPVIIAAIWSSLTVLGQILLGIPLCFLLRKIGIRDLFMYLWVGVVMGAIALSMPAFFSREFYILTSFTVFGAVHGLVCAFIGWLEVRHLPLPKDLKS